MKVISHPYVMRDEYNRYVMSMMSVADIARRGKTSVDWFCDIKIVEERRTILKNNNEFLI
jgi:hypothetical protein